MKDGELVIASSSYVSSTHGGESFCIDTNMFSNGEPGGIYFNQKLTLHSYCNSASFNFHGDGVMTPEILRRIANELEQAYNEAVQLSKNIDKDVKNAKDCIHACS